MSMKRASPSCAAAATQPPVLAEFAPRRSPAARGRVPHEVASVRTPAPALAANNPSSFEIPSLSRVQPASAAQPFAAPALIAIALHFAAAALGCASPRSLAGPPIERFRAPADAAAPGTCAWYGDSDGESLYFGESAFWAAMREGGGNPEADLARRGAKQIGRFDLAAQRMRPPVAVDVAGGSGIWDVLPAHGRVYFTTFFGPAGAVDPDSGALEVFTALGTGLNELAPGPDGTILASRYGAAGGGGGSVVRMTPNGERVAELELGAPPGYVAAPKTVAWDPVRREIWVTVDLVSRSGGAPATDARRLASDGREVERITEPEIQFVAFASDGTGYFAARTGALLELLLLEPQMSGPPLAAARRIVLDRSFPAAADFVQDIHPASDGRVVLTRWSGKVHVVDVRSEDARTVELPRENGKGLYYSGVLRGRRLCATYCEGIEVVCADLP